MNGPEYGAIVTSRAGHDKGRAFIIIGRADEAHVLYCDGESRTLSRPKKKKLMHVHVEPHRADEIVEHDGALSDADIRKALISRGYNSKLDR